MTSTREILSALAPRYPETWGLEPDDRARWQDVLQALRGVEREKIAYLFYVYGGHREYRHDLFAGLLICAMQLPEVRVWREGGKVGAVELLCRLLIDEWSPSDACLTNEDRAGFLKVSLSSWHRNYRSIYELIRAIPVEWEREVLGLVTKRLR